MTAASSRESRLAKLARERWELKRRPVSAVYAAIMTMSVSEMTAGYGLTSEQSSFGESVSGLELTWTL